MFQFLDPSLQLIDAAAKLVDLGLWRRFGWKGSPERARPTPAPQAIAAGATSPGGGGMLSVRPAPGPSGGGAPGCAAPAGGAQDDFGPQRAISTEELQRQAVARIESVENRREFGEQANLAARRADDQVLGLQAGAIGRSTAADAQYDHAAAGVIVGNRAKIDPLGEATGATGGPLEVRMPDSNRSNSPCAATGDVPPSPAANNATIPCPKSFSCSADLS